MKNRVIYLAAIAFTAAGFAWAAEADADTLSITATPPAYTVSGEASMYNTLVVRLAQEPCGSRSSAKYEATTPLRETQVNGAFSLTETLAPGTYRLCAYLYSDESLVIPHYPNPCSELYTPPVGCQEGERAEVSFTVQQSVQVMEPAAPATAPVAPAVLAPEVAKVTSSPKAPVSRKKRRKKHRRHRAKRRHHR